jgi:hypothetical protein
MAVDGEYHVRAREVTGDLEIRLIEKMKEKCKKKYRAEETVSLINCGEGMRWQIGRERMGSLRKGMGEGKILMENCRKWLVSCTVDVGRREKGREQTEVCETERVVVGG